MTSVLVQRHWDKIGRGYDVFWQSEGKKIISEKELSFINTCLRKAKAVRLLDIGIGTGRIITGYLNDPCVQEIYGIDIADSMVKFCRAKFSNEKRVKGIDVCNISKADIPFTGKYDFISAIRVLKYNCNWREIIQKTSKRLERNGIFVFTIANKRAFSRFTRPETPVFSATKKEIELLCRESNLELTAIRGFSKLPDMFYDLSNNKFFVKSLLAMESLLGKFLGDKLFERELFISAVKI